MNQPPAVDLAPQGKDTAEGNGETFGDACKAFDDGHHRGSMRYQEQVVVAKAIGEGARGRRGPAMAFVGRFRVAQAAAGLIVPVDAGEAPGSFCVGQELRRCTDHGKDFTDSGLKADAQVQGLGDVGGGLDCTQKGGGEDQVDGLAGQRARDLPGLAFSIR